jgi:hypothetical protein
LIHQTTDTRETQIRVDLGKLPLKEWECIITAQEKSVYDNSNHFILSSYVEGQEHGNEARALEEFAPSLLRSRLRRGLDLSN